MKQLMAILFVAGGLALVACGGSSNTGNNDNNDGQGTNKTCTYEFICQNGVCACGSDGSGAACEDPDEVDPSPSNRCDVKCEVCS